MEQEKECLACGSKMEYKGSDSQYDFYDCTQCENFAAVAKPKVEEETRKRK